MIREILETCGFFMLITIGTATIVLVILSAGDFVVSLVRGEEFVMPIQLGWDVYLFMVVVSFLAGLVMGIVSVIMKL